MEVADIVLIHGAGNPVDGCGIKRLGSCASEVAVGPDVTGVGERLADGGPETSLSTHIDDARVPSPVTQPA